MKFCTHCGNALQETDMFCSSCGASNVKSTTAADPATGYQAESNLNYANYQPNSYDPDSFIDPAVAEENKKNAIKALVFGILGVAFCYVPIVGIIFALIAKKTGKKVLNNNPTGVAKVLSRIGNILGIVGLVLSIIYTVCEILYLVYVLLYVVFIALLASLPYLL